MIVGRGAEHAVCFRPRFVANRIADQNLKSLRMAVSRYHRSKALRYIVATVALLFSSLAHGQLACKSSEACLSWKPPTRYENGTAIPAGTAITYRVYRLTNGIMTALPNTTAGIGIKLLNQPRGQQCYAVTAIIGGSESTLSTPLGCKFIRFPGPTDGSIERPTDGGIERN